MLAVQFLLAAIAIILLSGFALLFWMIDTQLIAQQRYMIDFHRRIGRLFNDAERGEVTRAIRDLRWFLRQFENGGIRPVRHDEWPDGKLSREQDWRKAS
jgi:hypothetical protein